MPTTPLLKPTHQPMFGSDTRLEDRFKEPFQTWKLQPTPENMDKLLVAVRPVMDQALRKFVRGEASPTIRSRAKLITIKALESYDPGRAQLNTHLFTNLQGLQRAAASEEQIISVPEQVSLDWRHLKSTEQDFKNEAGRDPSDAELADMTGLSLKRIQYVRQLPAVVAEGVYLKPGGEDETLYPPAVQGNPRPRDQAWLEFVYQDLGAIDQLILEHSLGMHNKPVLSNQRLAAKLRISPAAVSQRRVRIQSLLDKQNELQVF